MERIQLDIIRRMTPREKLEHTLRLNVMVERLAIAGIRRRHPEADDHEIWMQVTARKLGRDIMMRVYGWQLEDRRP